MRDIGLLKAFSIVFVFWYAVLMILVSGPVGLLSIPKALVDSGTAILTGCLIGVVMLLISRRITDASIAALHVPSSFRGMNISIGPFPSMAEPPKGFDAQLSELFLTPKLNNWFVDYEQKNPLHAALFRCVAGIYDEYGWLPASPVPGGHGGASLRKHSENVLIEMLETASKWKYVGHIGKTGKVLMHPLDGTWLYEKELAKSPLLPLIAYVHDLGKVECYAKQKGKNFIKEVQKNHDTVGKRILIRLDSFWALTPKDREIISMAVGYYHHIGRLPEWCDDAVRAASELLIYVDTAAGKKEGGVKNEYEDYAAGDPNMEFATLAPIKNAALPIEQVLKIAQALEIDIGEEAPLLPDAAEIDGAESVTKDESMVASEPIAPKPAAVDSSAQAEWIYGVFAEIISEPGRINGNVKNKRIGFKRDGWVYLNDADWRKVAAERTGNLSISQNEPGQISQASHLLLEALKARDALFYQFDGAEYSTKRALFSVRFYLPKRVAASKSDGLRGSIGSEWAYTLIFKADLISAIATINDCDGEIEVVKNGWGAHAAINKNGPPTLPSQKSKRSESSEKTKAEKIFSQQVKQREKGGMSDLQYDLQEHNETVYQCIRISDLKMAYPDIDWEQEPGQRATDDGGNKRLCLIIKEKNNEYSN